MKKRVPSVQRYWRKLHHLPNAYFQRWLAPRLEAAHAPDERAERVAAWRGLDTRGLEEAAIAQGRYLAFDAITKREPDLETAERSLEIVNQIERRRIEEEKLGLEERRMVLAERRVARREQAASAEGPNAERGSRSAEVTDAEIGAGSEPSADAGAQNWPNAERIRAAVAGRTADGDAGNAANLEGPMTDALTAAGDDFSSIFSLVQAGSGRLRGEKNFAAKGAAGGTETAEGAMGRGRAARDERAA